MTHPTQLKRVEDSSLIDFASEAAAPKPSKNVQSQKGAVLSALLYYLIMSLITGLDTEPSKTTAQPAITPLSETQATAHAVSEFWRKVSKIHIPSDPPSYI